MCASYNKFLVTARNGTQTVPQEMNDVCVRAHETYTCIFLMRGIRSLYIHFITLCVIFFKFVIYSFYRNMRRTWVIYTIHVTKITLHTYKHKTYNIVENMEADNGVLGEAMVKRLTEDRLVSSFE